MNLRTFLTYVEDLTTEEFQAVVGGGGSSPALIRSVEKTQAAPWSPRSTPRRLLRLLQPRVVTPPSPVLRSADDNNGCGLVSKRTGWIFHQAACVDCFCVAPVPWMLVQSPGAPAGGAVGRGRAAHLLTGAVGGAVASSPTAGGAPRSSRPPSSRCWSWWSRRT